MYGGEGRWSKPQPDDNRRHMRCTSHLAALPLALLCGCFEGPSNTGSPGDFARAGEPAAWKGPTWQPSEQPHVLLLDRIDALLDLPETNLPEGMRIEDEIEIDTLIPLPDRGQHVYEVPLPFNVPEHERRFAPAGMRVLHDDRELSYTMHPPGGPGGGTSSWRIEGGNLTVALRAEASSIRVAWPALRSAVVRLDPALARDVLGLAPRDYVRWSAVADGHSREGLLLPAPGKATWEDVTIPTDAVFRTHAMLLSTPFRERGDGVTVALRFSTPDGVEELVSQQVRANHDAFLNVEADLSHLAGRRGTLSLHSEPGPTADYDYLFLGSPQIAGAPERAPRRIIVIGLDTLRPDKLGVNGYYRNTSPELDAFARDAVRFTHAFTPAPRTRPSFRSALTGRLPLEAVCAPTFGRVLRDHGFATAGIAANVHLNPRFGFHDGFDLWWLDPKAKADEQVDRALGWLADHPHQDAALFLHIMDPHLFYGSPEPYLSRFTRDLPLGLDPDLPPQFNRWMVYRWARGKKLTPQRKAHIEALHDGDIAFTSAQLGRFFAALDAMPGETLTVIHSDHGEEFWEHGGFEHNHTLYDDVVRAVLWVRPPGGTGQTWATSSMPASLFDIAPTLFRFAGIANTPPLDGEDLLPGLRGEAPGAEEAWVRPLGIAHLRYDTDRWGVVHNNMKYILVTGTGEEELYDLGQDPAEQHNLVGTRSTAPFVAQLGPAHGTRSGPGMRIEVSLRGADPVTVDLPLAAVEAGVFAPDLLSRTPANKAWGESPSRTEADVAEVTLLDDGRRLQITPGRWGNGTLFLLFADETPDPRSFAWGDDATLREEDDGLVVELQRARLKLRPGPVLVPPMPEATRMAACEGAATSDEERDLLIKLGYISEDDDGHGH